VKDLSKLVINVLESRIEKKSYFVSDGKIYSSRDFGKYVSEALDKKQIQLPVPLAIARVIAFVNETLSYITGEAPLLSREKLRELSARNWSCDIKPLQSDFGFAPKYCLEKGIKETVRWYKDAGWLK
jgi:nucleoside-diphosphate-sugar epimerase